MDNARGKGGGDIRVGSTAYHDPIVARASFEAAAILLQASKRPARQRAAFIEDTIRETYGSVVARDYLSRRRELPETNQGLYDAMRLALADHYARMGIDLLRAVSAQIHGVDQGLAGTAKDVGCAITGGVTAIGGLVAGIYSGGAGAGAVGAGGTTTADAIGCNDAARAHQQSIAQAQARQAQAMATAARMEAEAKVATEQEKTRRQQSLLLIGGGAAAVLFVGILIAST